MRNSSRKRAVNSTSTTSHPTPAASSCFTDSCAATKSAFAAMSATISRLKNDDATTLRQRLSRPDPWFSSELAEPASGKAFHHFTESSVLYFFTCSFTNDQSTRSTCMGLTASRTLAKSASASSDPGRRSASSICRQYLLWTTERNVFVIARAKFASTLLFSIIDSISSDRGELRRCPCGSSPSSVRSLSWSCAWRARHFCHRAAICSFSSKKNVSPIGFVKLVVRWTTSELEVRWTTTGLEAPPGQVLSSVHVFMDFTFSLTERSTFCIPSTTSAGCRSLVDQWTSWTTIIFRSFCCDRGSAVIPSHLTTAGAVGALMTVVRKAIPATKNSTLRPSCSLTLPPASPWSTWMASARPTAPLSPPHVMTAASAMETSCLSVDSTLSSGLEAKTMAARTISSTT
mmetsp:Transcript_16252/g.43295  ORF Transcript_16252/g.43295 Transcript_16252/m.43295 type:complete len:402 (-) Transcript_16252:343-1548(-)